MTRSTLNPAFNRNAGHCRNLPLLDRPHSRCYARKEAPMDKSQLHEYWLFLVISLIVAGVLILGLVARILWSKRRTPPED